MSLDLKLKQMVLSETQFLEENQTEKNEHGVYIFVSQNGNESISLDYYLLEYKNWLIEKGIVKPIK